MKRVQTYKEKGRNASLAGSHSIAISITGSTRRNNGWRRRAQETPSQKEKRKTKHSKKPPTPTLNKNDQIEFGRNPTS